MENKKILFLVMNCRKHFYKREWIKDTWLKHFSDDTYKILFI